MFKSAAEYRIDWKSEFAKLAPYLAGMGGVVSLEYVSDEAAPEKFNHLLKEDFGKKPGNGLWVSIRIDHDWYTTRRAPGILDEFERLLADAGYVAEASDGDPLVQNYFSGNDIGGDMNITLTDVTFPTNSWLTAAVLSARLRVVCTTMKRFVESGGHLMIVVNDAEIRDQSEFWQRIWNAGLAEACGENVFLVIHAGPRARRRRHADAPEPDKTLFLPDSVEADDTRHDQMYDDLLTIFEREGFKEPGEAAVLYLSNNKSSVRHVNMRLSAAIMAVKSRKGSNEG